MANEAVKVEGPYEVHDFLVAAGATISAMTLCVLSEPRTAANATDVEMSDAEPTAFAGIAATEKTANSTALQLGLYTKGVFVLKAAGQPIKAGELLRLSGINLVTPINDVVALISGAVVGKAWEDIAASTTGEVHVGEVI